MNVRNSIRNLMCLGAGVAMAFTATTAQADISWAAGAPDGTGGGSAFFDQTGGLSVLSTGIATNQLLTQGINGTGASSEDYTISFWFNRDGLNGSSNNGEAWIIGSGDIGVNNFNTRGLHLGFTNANSGNLTQAHWSADQTGTTSVSASGWEHATFTYDGDGGSDGTTGLGSIYINGVLDTQGDQNGAFRDAGNLIIGSRVGGQGPSYNGRIDDLAIFNTVLDATQVDTLFRDTTQAVALGAGAYYDFEDDQTGTTAAVQGTGLGAIDLQGITANAVPEPSSLAIMLGLGVAGLTRRKRS